MSTLALTSVDSLTPWDLALDANGNMAVVEGPSAMAQDVASAIRLFLGELYYDTSQGVPYFSQIFAEPFSTSMAEALLAQATLSVPGVVSARATVNSFVNRVLSGTVNFIDTTGQELGITF